jgi:hypothetical protein
MNINTNKIITNQNWDATRDATYFQVVVYEDMEKIRQTLAKSDRVQQEGE